MYIPPDITRWRGRVDAEEGSLGRRWHEEVRVWQAQETPGYALLGFACDAGISRNQGRAGAKNGPAALRDALANLVWHQHRNIYDAGDVSCIGDNLEAAQDELSKKVAELLTAEQLPFILGGGHEMAFGSFNGLARYAEAQPNVPVIGIINLDAHFDLRGGQQATSGTPFRQIADVCEHKGWPFHYLVYGISELANTPALFQRARQLGTLWRIDEECIREHLGELLSTVESFSNRVDWIYLTICLDVLPGAIAPGVSAPASLGVELAVVQAIVDAIKMTGKIKLIDIAELNPTFDPNGQTARVASRLVWRLTR